MSLAVLDPVQIRVLACLLEKEMSTPEYYPLTLNALVNACSQSSNRDPVIVMEGPQVLEVLEALRDDGLAWVVNAPGARVIKYEHRLRERFNLSEQEAAVLCELMLRGPQTAGELRSRTARMYAFQDLSEVEVALDCLATCETPLVLKLPRAPGAREARVAHLLGGPVEGVDAPVVPQVPSRSSELQALKDEVAELKAQLAGLRAEFEAFKGQF